MIRLTRLTTATYSVAVVSLTIFLINLLDGKYRQAYLMLFVLSSGIYFFLRKITSIRNRRVSNE
jgi:hypothetical protein